MNLRRLGAAMIVLACTVTAAEARKLPRHDSQAASQCVPDNSGHNVCQRAQKRIQRLPVALDANGNRAGLVTISTAAGIEITVAPSFAPAIRGFIADSVEEGYRPTRITCFSLSRSHVRRSLHKLGEACDFNQHGWNKTDRFMYRVRALAVKWGLRDGCSFRDCGHIDAGRPLGTVLSARKHKARP